ncbi:hypothetical protein SKP52_14365 [Sphingopyxis fribergensis]|uniref:Uncharacterized protein n=1 Tax=Sphingopyxis fribergensis TaxID=1515612 RepID=A0A0A7PPD1_9SPHN|nr:hypothetical protein [Sphingopyxis fribergensis]AJA09757.1 hypothetical protein SKP52_14365 [Sphingopyxis fribergensis]
MVAPVIIAVVPAPTVGQSGLRNCSAGRWQHDPPARVGKIVLHPGAMRGEIHATLHGSLMGILDFANDNPAPDANRVITSVASGSPG